MSPRNNNKAPVNRINIDLVHEHKNEEDDFFISTGGRSQEHSPENKNARAH